MRYPLASFAALIILGALAALCPGAARAGPDEKPTRPVRPAWLVGIWEMKTPEGEGAIVLGADGAVSFTVKSGGEEAGQAGGSWVVEGDQLVISEGIVTARHRLERLPDEAGRPRVRFLEAGSEATAPVFTRRPDPAPEHPAWMCGTWSGGGSGGGGTSLTRLVLRPDGSARDVLQGPDKLEATELRWRMVRGTLEVVDGDVTMSQEIDFEPNDEGRLEMWLLGGKAVRTSWPPAKAVYEGPLVGHWERVDSLVLERLTFDPRGRLERRRQVDVGTWVEPGRFQVARGAQGELLQAESDAGRKSEWVYRVEGPRLTLLDTATKRVDVFQLVAGSPALVAREALNAAAAAADTWAENAFWFGARARVRVAPPAPPANPDAPPSELDPDDPGAAPDPAPQDVIVGAEVLARWIVYVGESEEVLARSREGNVALDAFAPDARARAEPQSARARTQVEWIFEPEGRARRFTLTFGADGTAGESYALAFGKYEIVGDLVTVHLAGEPVRRLRLAEGGLYLHDGRQTLLPQLRWIGGTLRGSK